MKKLKIAIIGQWCYPANTPRAFRAWELAKEFAREGHDVTLYALLGEYDYSNLEKTLNFKIKNLGYSKLGNTNSSDINAPLPILARMILRIVKDPNIYPGIEFFPMIRRALKQEKGIDLLITIAHPHVIHWATSASIDRTLVKYWVADCGDPYMGNPFSKHPFFMKWVEKKWCQKADFITIPIKEGINAYFEIPEKRRYHVPIIRRYSFKEPVGVEATFYQSKPSFNGAWVDTWQRLNLPESQKGGNDFSDDGIVIRSNGDICGVALNLETHQFDWETLGNIFQPDCQKLKITNYHRYICLGRDSWQHD